MSKSIDTHPIPRAPLGLLLTTGAIIFFANAGLLILQLLAGRYLAPFIGSSIETWTSVIGVFLSGIALGNWLGGRVADRYPSTKTLAILLILGGISSLTLWGGSILCEATGFHQSLSLGIRIPLLTSIFCLLPATIISMITPLVIKLAMADVRRAGRVAGLSFALSTLGCLLGNYLTGFWFMAEYTLNTISLATALFLALLGVIQLFLPRGEAATQPMLVESDASIPTSTTANEDDLNLRGNIRYAYLIVFICSFCGMSLELTASRVLAPQLGVSLYTWTGIIGVMLAGTALGNYFGGVLADRGVGPALRGISFLVLGLIGFATAHSIAREFGWIMTAEQLAEQQAENPNAEITQPHWLIHLIGVGGGFLLAAIGVLISRMTFGSFINLMFLGGAIGAVLIRPVLSQIGRLIDRENDRYGQWVDKLSQIGNSVGLSGEDLLLIVGFLIGVAMIIMLNGLPSRDESRASRSLILSFCLFFASLLTIAVVILVGIVGSVSLMRSHENIVEHVLAWTFVLFFAPMFLLGTISPQVIRLTVANMQNAGKTAGSIYAVSTLGAIVGTFATGYFLIGAIGMYSVVLVIGFILAMLSLYVGRLWKSNVMLFGFSLIVGVCVVGMLVLGYKKDLYEMETKYYAISVKTEASIPNRNVRTLVLDMLIHSMVDLDDPTWLHYEHEYVQDEILQWVHSKRPETNLMIVGGGGYTFPRCVEYSLEGRKDRIGLICGGFAATEIEPKLPKMSIDVIEIDPGVTETAHRRLGLPRDTKIRSFNMDGRQYVQETAKPGQYHLIVQDAVNDLSVPYHLLTKEYNDGIQRILTEDGIYLLTFIDKIRDGKLWKAAARTMKRTFKHVYLLAPGQPWEGQGRSVCILYGSNQPIQPEEVFRAVKSHNKLASDGELWMQICPENLFEELLKMGRQLELSDQYAPVDNLMSDVFAERGGR